MLHSISNNTTESNLDKLEKKHELFQKGEAIFLIILLKKNIY